MAKKKKKGGARVSETLDGHDESAIVSKVPKPSPRSEIDEIFAAAKSRKKAAEAAVTPAEGSDPETKSGGGDVDDEPKKKKMKRSGKESTLPLKEKGEKREKTKVEPKGKTQEGFNVYAEEDLGWNRKDAGGTPLCPFDCDCCF